MTMTAVCSAPTFRRGGNAYQNAQTLIRWEQFRIWAPVARKMALRAAAARARRRCATPWHESRRFGAKTYVKGE